MEKLASVAKWYTQRTQNAPSYGHESSNLSPATRFYVKKPYLTQGGAFSLFCGMPLAGELDI